MRHRLIRLFVVMMRLLTWLCCIGLYFVIMSFNSPHLLRINRTSLIVFLAYSIVYLFMTNIYGGLDIGTRKSRPIIYALALDSFFSNAMAHLFLCIMNYSKFNHMHLRLESPLLLILIFILQCACISILTYWGNHLYFSVEKPQSCLIIAARGDNAQNIIQKVKRFQKQYRIDGFAYYDDADIYDHILNHHAIFLANLSVAQRNHLVEFCYEHSKDVYYTMELGDIIATGAKKIRFGDLSLMYAPAEIVHMDQRIVKRFSDILISIISLVILSPILIITAIAIKAEDGGSVFYHQQRSTYGGRVFSIIKFRSMKQTVGNIHQSVTENDDRITKVGRFIRKYRIDELPQLLNVLKSDMSIVGPRPEMLENMQKYCNELPEFSYRLRAKAGITGLAQVYGKYNTAPKDKLTLDLLYIQNFSIWQDIKILFRTILVLFTPDESTEAFTSSTQETQL